MRPGEPISPETGVGGAWCRVFAISPQPDLPWPQTQALSQSKLSFAPRRSGSRKALLAYDAADGRCVATLQFAINHPNDCHLNRMVVKFAHTVEVNRTEGP